MLVGEAGFMSNRAGVNHGHGGSVARTLRRHVAYYSNRNAPDVGATSLDVWRVFFRDDFKR